MNNEAILNKLVELGYVYISGVGCVRRVDNDAFLSDVSYFKADRGSEFLAIQDALIAECEKQGAHIIISKGILKVERYEDDGDLGTNIIRIHEAPYSRQAIIEAFCKVTGVKCE